MRQVVVALVLLLAPAGASADPATLSYAIDEKAWKQVRADTALTFSLYEDASCTNLFNEFVFVAESVPLIVRLKRTVPKGAAKVPKTAELRLATTLQTPPPNLYLRVTGTGVTPVGPECQPQAGGANAAWHWITAEEDIVATSPSLAGTVVTRLTGEPAGRYCIDFPDGAPIDDRGIVGSLQVTFAGYVIRVNSINNNLCNANAQGAVQVSVDQLNAGAFVPANGAYTLMLPGTGAVIPPN